SLFCEDNRLHAGEFETFAAAQVLAGHQVIFAKHVGAGLSKAGAIALISTSGELPLLGSHQPNNLVFGGLMAMGTIQRSCLLFWPLVKKFALFHGSILIITSSGRSSYGMIKPEAKEEKKSKTVQCGTSRERAV